MKSKFTVTFPSFLFPLGVFLIALMVFITILQIVINDAPYTNIWTYSLIGLGVSVGLPVIMMEKIFKITVNSNKITVRTTLGFKYSFDVSEIISVERRVSSKNLSMERMFIKTSKGKRLKLDSFMVGYEKMIEYLSSNGKSAK